MKTTIDLPDSTFRQAKVAAAALGMTLKQFFTEALEDRLRHDRSAVGNGTEPPWMAGFGGLSDLAEENRRVLETIEREGASRFERGSTDGAG